MVDKFWCPRCKGVGYDDKKDAVFSDIDVNCTPGQSRLRGRVGSVEGDDFSGLIVQLRGKVHHFRLAPEDDLSPL